MTGTTSSPESPTCETKTIGRQQSTNLGGSPDTNVALMNPIWNHFAHQQWPMHWSVSQPRTITEEKQQSEESVNEWIYKLNGFSPCLKKFVVINFLILGTERRRSIRENCSPRKESSYSIEISFTEVLIHEIVQYTVRSLFIREESIEKSTKIFGCPSALSRKKRRLFFVRSLIKYRLTSWNRRTENIGWTLRPRTDCVGEHRTDPDRRRTGSLMILKRIQKCSTFSSRQRRRRRRTKNETNLSLP